MARRTWRMSIIATAVALAFSATPAHAWIGEFFDGRASGQAVYEDMAIHPQAVRVDDKVYVVYQGEGMDPYIISFVDGGTQVDGPYKIGENPAVGGVNRDDQSDSHGAPALLLDPATGQLHVWWGAHLTALQYSRNLVPGDISKWETPREIVGRTPVTYPQPSVDPDGVLHLFLRRDSNSDGKSAATSLTNDNGSWVEITSSDGGTTWTKPDIVLRANAENRWYAHFEPGADGRVHGAFITDDFSNSDPFVRKGVFYAVRDESGVWRDPVGRSIVTSEALGIQESDLATDSVQSAVCTDTATSQNQVTVAEDPDGNAGLLYLDGGTFGPDSQRWIFSRFDGDTWVKTEIAKTDHFMDSGTIEYRPDGTLEAFLTMEGTTGAGKSNSIEKSYEAWVSRRYWDRGGDIVQWTSSDRGATWTRGWERQAKLDEGIVYNDPQFVQGHDGASRLLFGEWDNDAGNYVHKVYLWGSDGLRGREFFPQAERLGGANRYETAVSISREAFPTGANYIVVASGEVYADALAGIPLAETYKAPLLLVSKDSVPASVTAEIKRLAAENVIVLGGTSTITDATKSKLKVGKVRSVTRISGSNRYAVAAAIAGKLKERRGAPSMAFVVSGENFPDALSVSALAAVRGAPVLLTRAGQLPPESAAVLKRGSGVVRTIVVGGPASVSDAVLAQLPSPTRVPGATRYDAAANVALMGLDGAPGVPARTLRTDRVVVASGEVFADALAGGALAARLRCPIFLTRGSELSPVTAGVLDAKAREVLDYYFLGGERTLTEGVAASVTDVLREHQLEQR